MKKILGLDLGTTSDGWAYVHERENEDEKSEIISIGVRVNPLTTDEIKDFTEGRSITTNADRTQKRGARRNLDRYQMRRDKLIEVLKDTGIINESTILAEEGKNSTHSLWRIRAKAVDDKISLEDFARILLAINKKRGYKSNRKTKGEEEGEAIDAMDIAMEMNKSNITPGQYVLKQLKNGKKFIPDFYRSDLQNEFNLIWDNQKKYYPDILSDELKKELFNKAKNQTWKICEAPFGIQGIKINGTKDEVKFQKYEYRVKGLSEKIDLEYLAIVLQEINGQIYNSSGYLGEISDRSKKLYFNNLTVGQYLYNIIKEKPHTRLKNQVFYRQDYMDEFDKIWDNQAKYHKKLTPELKSEIRDKIVFYQRNLKSQKSLISICELEGKEIEKDGKKIIIGPRVIPKSSPLFQEFKIWQILNNIIVKNKINNEKLVLDIETKEYLFEELNQKGKLSSKEILKQIGLKPKEWELNYKNGIEGNNTNSVLYKAYQEIMEISGHSLDLFGMDANSAKDALSVVFENLGINKEILDFDSELKGGEFVKQAHYQLWHLLYSYEDDNSKSGNVALYKKLEEKFGFKREYAKPLVSIVFKDDYGSLSAKAIKKILPFMKDGYEYSEAGEMVGYRHSKHSLTVDEIENRKLEDKLELLPKNSLRNPVVEKILNQMINLVNDVILKYGKPDEVRIELARELKKNADERKKMTIGINNTQKEHEKIKEILREIFPFNTGVRITRNDIIKYKLYKELEFNGYKTLYTNTYVPLEKLYSKEFDIEHIIPKALLFDDSFSNKTLAVRDFNLTKSNKTGIDAIVEKYGKDSEEYFRYTNIIEELYKNKKISKSKYKKLLMTYEDIPDNFIERDLRLSQYISKKAIQILEKAIRRVVPTSGSITSKLREDWQLINVLKELNWEKYEKLGLTYYEKSKDGKNIAQIKDWTKRNDHRHHAVDALTIAFTKHSHIQYFNYLNARKNEKHKLHSNIYAIEQKETFKNDKGKIIIKPPIPLNQFRSEVKKQLENILVSFKTKNKVITKNRYKTKKRGGYNINTGLTPRGQLHKETIYGASKYYKTKYEKIGTKFDEEKINTVAKKGYREALMKRLKEYDNDPKKAFGGKNSLSKNPIYLDEYQSAKIPEKVKLVWFDNRYTIRKDINPDNFKNQKHIEKVIDVGQRKLLFERLKKFDNNFKDAFSNLENNPIWLDKKNGISLKRVSILGVSNALPIHNKKDHYGNLIVDGEGKPIPVDFVSEGNNHHVAIYMDDEGNYHEEVVSFFEAVTRVNTGIPVVKKHHEKGWKFIFTMKQNEMFVFPNRESAFDPNDIDLMDKNNYDIISPNLFRVQKISKKNYLFAHQYETKAISGEMLKKRKELKEIIYYFIQSPQHLKDIVKVRINHLGEIVNVGEY